MPTIIDVRHAAQEIIDAHLVGNCEAAEKKFDSAACQFGQSIVQKELLDLCVEQGAASARQDHQAESAKPYLWLALEFNAPERREEVFFAFFAHKYGLEVPYDRTEHEAAMRHRAQVAV